MSNTEPGISRFRFFRLSGLTLEIARLNKTIKSAPHVISTLKFRVNTKLLLILAGAFQSISASSAAPEKVPQSAAGWKADIIEGDRRLSRKELTAAEVCYREALRVVRKDKTASSDDRVTCLEHLASILQTEDETDESIRLYKTSLKILQKEHGKDSLATVPTRTFLGDIYMHEAQYYPASVNYGDALSILAADPENREQRIADLRHRLGYVTAKVGSTTLTSQLYRESLSSLMKQHELIDNALLEKVLDDYCDLLYKSLGTRASSVFQNELLKDDVGTLTRTKNVEDSFWTKAVAARFTDGKANNPDQSNAPVVPTDLESEKASRIIAQANSAHQSDTNQLATTPDDFVSLSRINNQRIDFYKRMIAVDVKTLGPEHPSVARDLSGLAYVYLSQDKIEDAKILLNRALKIYQLTYTANPMLVKRTQAMLDSLEQRQSPQVTEVLFRNYLSGMPQIPLQAQKLEIALRLNYLGLLCYSEGRYDEAEQVYSWALASTALACGERSTFAGSCLADYARALRATEKQTQAEQLEVTAQQIFSSALAKQAAASLP